MKFLVRIAFMLIITASVLSAAEWSQTFLSLRQTGVESFLEKHPEYDGRGTIIMVLDTGVDQGIEGLTKTSTGEVKVIDVQDFTGQGDIKIYEAEQDEDDGKFFFINEDQNLKIEGANNLSLKAVEDEYFIGVLSESLWKNSASQATDVNGNGTEDDLFHIVVFETEENGEKFWVAYFDKNSDGNLADEKPIRSYKEKFDSFTIPNNEGLCNFTIGLNIYPDEKRVNFHFDDGAHGTHCAGIAAGSKIGETILNGVAPGANVMSFKIGNNNFAGGSTVIGSMKKAFIYADKISKEREEPCIINMSYGIGSEIEGKADIELFLEDLLKENPYLYFCTSNGNEGPGISTAGLPSASKRALSSGAVLTKEVAAENYGSIIEEDIILYFSSRGAEVGKPDIVSPGACTSTVPNWEAGDRYWGTSMASPYSAGVVSLLLSAAKVEYPDVKIPSGLLFKIIRESAAKLAGYDHVDQGSGYINVEYAYTLLKKYIDSKEIKNYEEYTISSISPNMPNGKGECLYLRNGSYLSGKETITFYIDRENFINKKKFYRIYNLKSDSDWLIPIQKNVYIRNDQSAYVQVKFDVDKMKEPGLYNGKIYASRSGKSAIPEFELMATVVIPYEFTKKNDYKLSFEGKLAPGKVKRYFVNVPAGASAMRLTLKSDEGKFTSSKIRVHDPDGRQYYVSPTLNSLENDDEISKTMYNLQPGVYEVDVTGYYRATDYSNYKLKIDFAEVSALDKKVLTEEKNYFNLINNSDKVKKYTLKGVINGCEKEYEVNLNGIKEIPFIMKKEMSKKVFDISLSKEDYNTVTDFAFIVVDKEGKAVAKSGLSYKDGQLVMRNKTKNDSTEYILKLLPGFANEESSISVQVTEKTFYKKTKSFSATNNNTTKMTIYPSITTAVFCDFNKPEFEISDDEKYMGVIYLTPKSKSEIKLEIPVHIKM